MMIHFQNKFSFSLQIGPEGTAVCPDVHKTAKSVWEYNQDGVFVKKEIDPPPSPAPAISNWQELILVMIQEVISKLQKESPTSETQQEELKALLQAEIEIKAGNHSKAYQSLKRAFLRDPDLRDFCQLSRELDGLEKYGWLGEDDSEKIQLKCEEINKFYQGITQNEKKAPPRTFPLALQLLKNLDSSYLEFPMQNIVDFTTYQYKGLPQKFWGDKQEIINQLNTISRSWNQDSPEYNHCTEMLEVIEKLPNIETPAGAAPSEKLTPRQIFEALQKITAMLKKTAEIVRSKEKGTQEKKDSVAEAKKALLNYLTVSPEMKEQKEKIRIVTERCLNARKLIEKNCLLWELLIPLLTLCSDQDEQKDILALQKHIPTTADQTILYKVSEAILAGEYSLAELYLQMTPTNAAKGNTFLVETLLKAALYEKSGQQNLLEKALKDHTQFLKKNDMVENASPQQLKEMTLVAKTMLACHIDSSVELNRLYVHYHLKSSDGYLYSIKRRVKIAMLYLSALVEKKEWERAKDIAKDLEMDWTLVKNPQFTQKHSYAFNFTLAKFVQGTNPLEAQKIRELYMRAGFGAAATGNSEGQKNAILELQNIDSTLNGLDPIAILSMAFQQFEITPKNTQELLKNLGMKTTTVITTIDSSNVKFTSSEFDAFLATLRQCNQLQELDLSNTKMDKHRLRSLLEVLKDIPHFRKLHLCNNSLSMWSLDGSTELLKKLNASTQFIFGHNNSDTGSEYETVTADKVIEGLEIIKQFTK